MPNGSSHPAAAQNAEGAGGQAAKQSGPDPLLGRSINDRFKITGLIARGGMGKVYKAEQAPLGRVCAIKVLNPNYSGDHDPEFHKRFFLEASISSKLTHPNTVTIFDYGRTDDNIYYMAMEFLEGRTLHRTLREEGPFVEERATHIARQICRSLREAHSLGVIHRDLKPANVYLIEHGDEKDFVKVLDFGLVKNIEDGKGEDLTQTGLFMGSPKYMAPEQIRGEHVDARTDIYALGVILYEMVTGKVPFDRPNSVNILMAHVNEPVPRLRDMKADVAVSEALESTIYKCMEKNPDDRFKSMDEVLAALKRAGGGTMTATVSGDRSGAFDLLSTTGSFTPQPTPGSISSLSPDSGSGAILAGGTTADQKKGSKTPLIIGGVVALLGVIGVIAMVSSKGGDASPTTQPTTSAPALSVPAPTPTPSATNTTTAAASTAAAADEPVRLKIETEPSGAQVREDGTIICDKTPCEVLVTDKPRKLSLELKDYKNDTISVKKGDPTRTIKLQKEKTITWSPPAGGGKKDTPPAGGGSKDFKDSPY